MLPSTLQSEKVTQDTTIRLKDVTSLTVSNYGSADLQLTVNGVKRLVPAFNPTYRVPYGAYNLDGDNTAAESVELKFEFEAGTKEAILDYRKLKNPICDAAQT